jgi:hypothetical protein
VAVCYPVDRLLTPLPGTLLPGLGGTATISGTVTFTDGRPAARRPVEWRPLGDPGGGSTAQTAADGGYVITDLRDGEYLVGFFHPDRVPLERNPEVETAPDLVPSEELQEIGEPVVRRVQISNQRPVSGIDFVITDIGDEIVVGPESGGLADLPAAGSDATAATQGDGSRSIWYVPLILAIVLLVSAGAYLVARPLVRQRVK